MSSISFEALALRLMGSGTMGGVEEQAAPSLARDPHGSRVLQTLIEQRCLNLILAALRCQNATAAFGRNCFSLDEVWEPRLPRTAFSEAVA